MTQSDLDRAVSRVLGESVEFVSRRGFSLLEPLPDSPDLEEQFLDWDLVEQERTISLVDQKPFRCVA